MFYLILWERSLDTRGLLFDEILIWSSVRSGSSLSPERIKNSENLYIRLWLFNFQPGMHGAALSCKRKIFRVGRGGAGQSWKFSGLGLSGSAIEPGKIINTAQKLLRTGNWTMIWHCLTWSWSFVYFLWQKQQEQERTASHVVVESFVLSDLAATCSARSERITLSETVMDTYICYKFVSLAVWIFNSPI